MVFSKRWGRMGFRSRKRRFTGTYKRAGPKRRRTGSSARVKFGSTRSLNYKGVGFRKETVSESLRFSYISGTGTNDGLYGHASYVTAAGPTNWTALKQLFGQYQIRGFKITLYPPYTNVESTSQAVYQTPSLWYKKDCVDSVTWASLDEANQAQAKMMQFTKPRSFYVQCKPEIELDTTGGVKIPVDHRKTWIPTELDTIKHRGMKFMVGDLDSTAFGTGNISVRAQVTYYYSFKQQE